MIHRIMRRWLSAVAGLLLAGILIACGAARPAAGPEERVQAFFADFSAAVNDPQLADPARRQALADQLAGYVKPSQRDGMRDDWLRTFSDLSTTSDELVELTGVADPDIRLSISIDDLTTRLVEQDSQTALVELTGGTVRLAFVGADVDRLGLASTDLSQELSIGDFLAQTGAAGGNTIALERVEGAWYLDLSR